MIRILTTFFFISLCLFSLSAQTSWTSPVEIGGRWNAAPPVLFE